MTAKFFLQDFEELVGKKGDKKVTKDVLYFSLNRAPTSGTNVPSTHFEDRARREHVEQYPDAYAAFKKANPSFKLEWPELDFEVVATPPPVEKAPESEEGSKKGKKSAHVE